VAGGQEAVNEVAAMPPKMSEGDLAGSVLELK